MKKIIFSLITLFFICSFSCSQTSEYKIANKFHLDGDEGWDYISVDDASGLLYVSHGSIVQVVDETNGTVKGTITGLNGVHGIAVASDLNKGFISCGRDSSVTVFDLKTYAVLEKINVTGRNPDAIQYDPYSHKVFTFNGGSSNSTVIDAKTNTVIGTISLPGRPEFSAADGKGKVYVNIEDKSMLSVINANSMQVENTWSVSPGEEPSGLAMDMDARRLFIVCSNKTMIVMDADNGKIITTLLIGDRVDGVGFDSVKKRAYSSNGDGTLTVVQESDINTFYVLENVETQRGARTTAVDSKTHHIFLPTAEFDPPPEPTPDNPHPRPKIKPGTFVILDVAPVK